MLEETMKITKITLNEFKPFIKDKNTNNIPQQEEGIRTTTPIINAYKDYNLNFRGRTPENFYAQEFNIKYMPQTMKEFLNSEYEERKHIPPEQLMSESFKYLAVIDNFADVKSTYPDETLFDNLHEASLKGRSGILSDIKLAKEMSDTPLINDGTDHFGIYLLRKIYLEGKTIKEINKDFYEKDLNPEYKGIITQPITYGTTSAYGIQYPKTDFWNSFIATRDEYKKFFVNLPKKNKTELTKELTQINSNKKTQKDKPIRRKYTIKNHQKEQIKKDIIKTKGDEEALKKAITKRFSKDDPEASFFVKYLSPIMTIAADKIHLSEELKDFAENIKSKENKIEDLLIKFWKTHPELLEYYSTAITDTIDLFEETYESGGLLPINNEYKVITPSTSNQKAIDYVPQRFVELLNYMQSIVPNREQKYAHHAEEQNKWNDHFLWRYGEITTNLEPKEEEKKQTTALEILEECAEANNAKVYTLKGFNGEDIKITANLDETLGDYLRNELIGYPPKFIEILTRRALKSPLMTEDAKLSFATISLADKIHDERILGETERKAIINYIKSELSSELTIANMAALDVVASKSNSPHKIYRMMLEKNLDEDTDEYANILMKNLNQPEFNQELNRLYDLYRVPLTNAEKNKILNILFDYVRNFNIMFSFSDSSVLYQKPNFIKALNDFKEKCSKNKSLRQIYKNALLKNLSDFNFSKALLFNNGNKDLMKAKTEMFANILLKDLLEFSKKSNVI